MPALNPARGANRFIAVLVVLAGVSAGAISTARRPPSPSATSRALDTPVVDHVPGGGPDGGAVSSLAIVGTRPAMVFAAFQNGGVFKSSDRGATWTPADRGLPEDAWCELVAAPASSSTLYAACGDGLFKTTNGGAIWRQLDLDNPVPPVVAPSDPRVVYQPPQYGVVRSQDGGGHWEQVHGSIPTRCGSAFAVDPADPLVLFCGDDEWVKVSRDGGVTWTPSARGSHPDAEITALAIDPSDRNTILAGTFDGRTFKTTTRGMTWYYASDGPATGPIDHLEFVGKSGDIVFAVQGDSILRSLDSGDHWQILPSAVPPDPVVPFAVDPLSPSTVYVGTRDGVMVTTDFGEHWVLRQRGIARATASVVLHEGTTSTLYASTGRESFASRDAGGTWTTFRPDGIADMTTVSLASDGASGVVARTASGTYRLRRGETTWAPFASPAGSNPAQAWVAAADRSPLFASMADGFVFSDDGGSRWLSARLPGDQIPTGIAIATGEPLIVYASTGGILGGLLGRNGIWRTLDKGETWQLMDDPPTHTVGHCCGLMADPNDRDTVYAIVSGVGIGGGGDLIRRTTDGGLTWAELPTPGLVLSFAVSPTVPTTLLAQVYDFTNAGRFVLMTSIDRGDHWTRAGAGLPLNVEITNIVADTRQPARLFAGTDGRGVFRSLDAGATWRPTGRLR